MSVPINPSHYARRPAPARPALCGRVETEVAVVGGGFAGLNTALGLIERGQREVVLLEAEAVGFGASGRNGGFVFGGYSLGESALLARLGPLAARALYRRSIDAVGLIRRRSANIDCDRHDTGVIWANWFRDPAVLEQRRRLLAEHYGVHWEPWSRERLGEAVNSARYSGALYEADALHLDPLAYARGLAAAIEAGGGRIHEHSPVRALRADSTGWRLQTAAGDLHARQVVLAGGGYLRGVVPALEVARLPIATYVMVTAPLGGLARQLIPGDAAIYDSRFAFDYYRRLPDDRILWGGRISIRDRAPAELARMLRADLARVFPALREVPVDLAWSGLMSYARHEMPQVGRLADGLWYAQAFGGHGLAPTAVAGEMLAAAMVEGDPGWQAFAPFGLTRTFGPLGLWAAQATYWRFQTADAWKDWRERR
jgi:gamma-glutamylputrescine oxidase